MREGKDVRDLDYGKITDKLCVTGCRGEENGLGICDLNYPMGKKPTPLEKRCQFIASKIVIF